MRCKAIVRTVSLIIIFFLSTYANAAPSYVFDTGKVVGINDLNIDGTLWDMQLHDMSFNELLASNGPSSFYTEGFALSTALALESYISIPGNLLPPDQYLSCTDPTVCNIATAIQFNPYDDTIVSWGARIDQSEVLPWAALWPRETNPGYLTWATWTTSYVPIPASVWLFSSGLIGLIGVARRKIHV